MRKALEAIKMVKSETKESDSSLEEVVVAIATCGLSLLGGSGSVYETTITDDVGNKYTGTGSTPQGSQERASEIYRYGR